MAAVATTMFTKEVSRFALMSKKECLQDLLNGFAPEDEGYKTIESKITDLDNELAKVGKGKGLTTKRRESDKPRALNAYNHFVKAKLPEIAKEHPEMDNRARMKHVSEIWKTMSAEAKAAYSSTTPV